MKKIIINLAVISLVALAIYSRNTNYRSALPGFYASSGSQARALKYRVYLFGLLPIAEADLSVDSTVQINDKECLQLGAKVRPLKFVSNFFKGRAEIDSFIDPNTLNPLVFRQKIILPGKPDNIKEALYDQKNRVMTIAGFSRTIEPDTKEPLSSIYFMRKKDLASIESLEIGINTNQKNYILKAKVSKKQIRIGKQEYLLFLAKSQVSRRDKNPYHRSNIDIVLLQTKSENLPVLIKVFASGGLIIARLIDIR